MCDVYDELVGQVEKREANEEQDDIESNLLLPAGVALRWATLSLKIYRAEDMPQSNPDSNTHLQLYTPIFIPVVKSVTCIFCQFIFSG